MYPALVMILVNTQRTSKALTSVSHPGPTLNANVNRGSNLNKTEVLDSMQFNANPAAVASQNHGQHGTVGLVSRQARESAMFNVTIDTMRGQDGSFSTVHEEDLEVGVGRSREDGRRDTYEDDRRRAKEGMV